MEIIPITSSSNSLLKKVRSLKERTGREKADCFILEGSKLFDEAITNGVDVHDVVVNQHFLDYGLPHLKSRGTLKRVSLVDDKLFAGLASTEAPQGIIAVASCRSYSVDELFSSQAPLVVIVDRVQDPGNLGTMLRTSLALGASGIILTKGSVDPYNPKVVRSAAGALFALPFVQDISAKEAVRICKEKGLVVLALSADGERKLSEVNLREPSAILLGNEAAGLAEEIERSADCTVRIPMQDATESLNVAIAHAIVMYEAMSQRHN